MYILKRRELVLAVGYIPNEIHRTFSFLIQMKHLVKKLKEKDKVGCAEILTLTTSTVSEGTRFYYLSSLICSLKC